MLLTLSVMFTACGNKCEHTYDNACDATCNECGETREVSAHQWNDATCTTLKTCTVCGTTEGEPLGHKPAEDDGDCGTDVLCTVCGAEVQGGECTLNIDSDILTPLTGTLCGKLHYSSDQRWKTGVYENVYEGGNIAKLYGYEFLLDLYSAVNSDSVSAYYP